MLKSDLLNSPSHVFGEHKNCPKYFCKGPKTGEKNLISEMNNCGLLDDILSCINRIIFNVNSLLLNMTNNAAEQYNSVINKFIGGKRINYSRRYSYMMRCSAAALSYNTKGNIHQILHKSLTKNSPGKHTKKFLNRREQRSKAKKKLSMNSRRNQNICLKNNGPDENYGPQAAEPDIVPELYENKKRLFLEKLEKTSEEIIQIQIDTVGQSANHLWHTERLNRLTASNFGRICKMRKNTSCAVAVKDILYSSFHGNSYTKYGIEKEPIAIREFEKNFELQIKDCGLFIDINDKYLAASPDGIVDETTIVEVKCPAVASKLTPVEAINEKKILFATYENEKMQLKQNHNYYYQIQGQLHITRREYCYFILWTPLGMLVEKIKRDDDFWNNKMKDQLQKFYFDCILPEIIDPRHIRNLPIRNPQYRN